MVRRFEYTSDHESYTSGSVATCRPPLLDRSKGRCQTERDTKTDAGSSVINSGLKHRANDARDSSSSYSNRRGQSSLNGCCTAVWKANGKTTTLSLFLNSLFQKTEIYMRGASSGDKIIRR